MPTSPTPFAHDSLRAADTCALSLKWSFQLMLELGGHRTFMGRHSFNDDELARELGLAEWVDDQEYNAAQALKALRQNARAFKVDYPHPSYPDRLASNIQSLAALLQLSDAELRVLGFCVLMHNDPVLSDATNLIGDLDEASLRRFDLKVHFGYLTQPQKLALFAAHLNALGLEDSKHVAGQRLRGEERLTPGDFAAVARRARFKPFASADELATALLAECRLKSAGLQKPIGFIH